MKPLVSPVPILWSPARGATGAQEAHCQRYQRFRRVLGAVPPRDPDRGGLNRRAWERTKVYTGSNVVSHNGHKWTAQWWTQGEEPGTTGQWGVWRDGGVC